jgi:hypothetical protein
VIILLSLFLLDYILGWVLNCWNLLLLLPQGRMGEGGGGQMGGFGFMEDVPKPLLPVRFFLEHTCCFVVSLFYCVVLHQSMFLFQHSFLNICFKTTFVLPICVAVCCQVPFLEEQQVFLALVRNLLADPALKCLKCFECFECLHK